MKTAPVPVPAHDPSDEFDVDLYDVLAHVDTPELALVGTPFAIFHFPDGTYVEIHLPGASLVVPGKPSRATEPVFMWFAEDAHIIESGGLNIPRYNYTGGE